MILYNVTLNVDPSIHHQWLQWMQHEHLPEVMATGLFTSYAMYKIQNHEAADPGLNYSVQYHANSLADYHQYIANHGTALKQKTLDMWGDKVLAFRTVLEKVL